MSHATADDAYKSHRIESIKATCSLLGIPPRLLTESDAKRLYGAGAVADAIWQNVQVAQEGLTADDITGATNG